MAFPGTPGDGKPNENPELAELGGESVHNSRKPGYDHTFDRISDRIPRGEKLALSQIIGDSMPRGRHGDLDTNRLLDRLKGPRALSPATQWGLNILTELGLHKPDVVVKSKDPTAVLQPGDVAVKKDTFDDALGGFSKIERMTQRYGVWAVGKAIQPETGELVDAPDSIVMLCQQMPGSILPVDYLDFSRAEIIPRTMSAAEVRGIGEPFDRPDMPDTYTVDLRVFLGGNRVA